MAANVVRSLLFLVIVGKKLSNVVLPLVKLNSKFTIVLISSTELVVVSIIDCKSRLHAWVATWIKTLLSTVCCGTVLRFSQRMVVDWPNVPWSIIRSLMP